MPKLKILYIPSEQFTNEMIKSLRVNKMDDFREKYRTIDILLFDDAQFLAGKKELQKNFFIHLTPYMMRKNRLSLLVINPHQNCLVWKRE